MLLAAGRNWNSNICIENNKKLVTSKDSESLSIHRIVWIL